MKKTTKWSEMLAQKLRLDAIRRCRAVPTWAELLSSELIVQALDDEEGAKRELWRRFGVEWPDLS